MIEAGSTADAANDEADTSVQADGESGPFDFDAGKRDVVVQDVFIDGAQCVPLDNPCVSVAECCPAEPPEQIFCFKGACRSCSNAGGPCEPGNVKSCCPPPPNTIPQFSCQDDPSTLGNDPRCCAPSGTPCNDGTAKYCCSAKCVNKKCQ